MTAAIVHTDDVLGGKARIAGTRVAVVDVIERLWAGEDVEDLAADYGLSVEEIEAAREYAADHFEEIEAAHRERTDTYEELLEESRAPRPAE